MTQNIAKRPSVFEPTDTRYFKRFVQSLWSKMPEVGDIVATLGLTTNRLSYSSDEDMVASVDDLTDWIAGTTDEITITDDGDGTLTISLPPAIKLDGATAERLLSTDADKKTASVADLTAWIAGTTGEIIVTSDGDGTLTISLPDAIVMPDGGTIGQAAGPLLTFDDTNDFLEISGCDVGIGTATPTAMLDVYSDIFRLRTAKTPAGAGAVGNAGDMCWDSGFFYVCVDTNTWKKAEIATWV